MTYPRALAITWGLALLLALLLAYDVAHAGEVYLDIKGGLNAPIRTTPDGTFWQEAFEHKTRAVTPAYAVGLGYQYTPTVSFQAHWLDLGESQIKGLAVGDVDYDHKHHRCLSKCDQAKHFRSTDTLRGVDFTVSYTWVRDGLRPFIKGGVAVLEHRSQYQNHVGGVDNFRGIAPELEFGGGIRYEWAYLEVDYFQGVNFGGQNLPISTQQVVMWAGVHIPFWR